MNAEICNFIEANIILMTSAEKTKIYKLVLGLAVILIIVGIVFVIPVHHAPYQYDPNDPSSEAAQSEGHALGIAFAGIMQKVGIVVLLYGWLIGSITIFKIRSIKREKVL